ncbi:hypothetical protein ACHQM5_000373 [Ranunculus cassubicifolius]
MLVCRHGEASFAVYTRCTLKMHLRIMRIEILTLFSYFGQCTLLEDLVIDIDLSRKMTIGKAKLSGNLYYFQVQPSFSINYPSVNLSMFDIWHLRLGHICSTRINKLSKVFPEISSSPCQSNPVTVLIILFPGAYRRCQATLNSSSKLDALASSAKWEPPHGRFWHFSYPWGEYVKVGAVLRYCAYEVMALHGVLHAEIQAPQNLRIAFRMEILDASNNVAELVRSLGKEISNMVSTPKASSLLKVHTSTERLQRAIDMHSYLLTSCHEDLSISSKTVLSHTLSTKLSHTPSTKLSHTLSSNLSDLPSLKLPTSTAPTQTESYHESMKKSQRRLYSWPSRELDAFDESGLEMDNVPRMKALESTAAMSLATFSSILIEFVARIDHLVESVNDLAKMAKFKHENV